MNTIGIDIGGTQLRVALFDEEYNILDVYKTNNDRNLTAAENMDKLIPFILSQKMPIKGIGIGCPGPMNLKTGTILNPPNLVGWDNFPLVSYVKEKTGLPTVMNNDANLAGFSEAMLGNGKGFESVVYMGLSTGLGGAYIYRGQIVNGAHGNAAELWNMIVNEDPHCHKNASPGSINEQSCGLGLQVIAAERFGREVTPKELFALYHSGNPIATDIVDKGAEALARGVANICVMVDPDVIVVGGSIAIYNPDYVDLMVEKAKAYLLMPEELHIEKAVFGDDAGLIGAALLAGEIV